ncbi:MAG: DNA polymerase I [Patescibacteria group bacterium]
MRRLVLIDGNALVHRAFHALPPLTAPDGRVTNAVFGVASILIRMIADVRPTHIIATFDRPEPTFRHEQFTEYKAHREKAPDELYAQIPLVQELMVAMGIPVLEAPGFEADDIIGTLVHQLENEPDMQIVIATGDLDTLQLVKGESVVVLTPKKGLGETALYDEKAVHARFGITPDQVADFKGLKGDPSDNIPGVPGIGDKTASTLLGAYETVEGVIEAATTFEKGAKKERKGVLTEKLAEKLVAHADEARFSRELATIRTDAPVSCSLESAQWRDRADAGKARALIEGLGFRSLVRRIEELFQDPAEVTGEQPAENLELFPAQASGSLSDLVLSSAIAVMPGGADVWAMTEGGVPVCISQENTTQLIPFLTKAPRIVGYDIKEVLHRVRTAGLKALPQVPLFDTHIAAWLCAPDVRAHDLPSVLRTHLRKEVGEGASGEQCALLFDLSLALEGALAAAKSEHIYANLEAPLIPVLEAMEERGILVDKKVVEALRKKSQKERDALSRDIFTLAGEEFNINSSQQMAKILYEKLALGGKIKKTSTGRASTAAGELEKLVGSHPIIEKILDYRELEKLISTYIEPFPALIATDGRIHTTYNQTVAATGRLSSQDPNLQNIPTRTAPGREFRKAFVPAPGSVLVSCDYSQLELRLAAHIAEDPVMIEAFRTGQDIHARTAATIFKVPLEEVTKDMRRQAKVLNFGILYGMGSLGFARAAGVDRATATAFIEQYFKEFAGVARYVERMHAQARDEGYVATLWGRKRFTPDARATFPQMRAQAERIAVNHPLQGTNADLIKKAMILIERELPEYMLLQVHDELVFEIPKDRVGDVATRARSIMESIVELSVPLIVDVASGDSWGSLEPLSLPR